ncbi:hypothetical protein CHC07_01830 [Variovorax sp. B4]|nr:hypothetical protein CHC07_01830 [Variovorax sp. B4]PNG60106.1 hypothetical protein CHC06_00003 [Variovorax sp. B2]
MLPAPLNTVPPEPVWSAIASATVCRSPASGAKASVPLVPCMKMPLPKAEPFCVALPPAPPVTLLPLTSVLPAKVSEPPCMTKMAPPMPAPPPPAKSPPRPPPKPP